MAPSKLPQRSLKDDTALPPDVRKRSALPSNVVTTWGYAPENWAKPKSDIEVAGRPKAFRTSGGGAALLTDYLAEAEATKIEPPT